MMLERRFTELRVEDADNRVLAGDAMVYGTVADIGGWFRETFERGAFGPDVQSQDVRAVVQHDRGRIIGRTGGGGLALSDSDRALEMRLSLPSTREADDTMELVRRGILRGLSIEFTADEERAEGDLRTVTRATLYGISVVDAPAYSESTVAARWCGANTTSRCSTGTGNVSRRRRWW